VRCFLAVPIAEPALAEAQQLAASLRDRVAATRWARPETLHLTVHFFGNIDEERALTAVELVRPLVTRTTTFDVELDTLGAFPSRGVPRVLWLGASRDAVPLTALALECRAVLRGAGFDVEERPYHAHCTLGRPRLPWNAGERASWTAALAESHPVMRFTATRLVLYDSHPGPGGAVYTERGSLDFRSPPAEG